MRTLIYRFLLQYLPYIFIFHISFALQKNLSFFSLPSNHIHLYMWLPILIHFYMKNNFIQSLVMTFIVSLILGQNTVIPVSIIFFGNICLILSTVAIKRVFLLQVKGLFIYINFIAICLLYLLHYLLSFIHTPIIAVPHVFSILGSALITTLFAIIINNPLNALHRFLQD